MENKNILIGITGGIAAYKICELIRIFKRNNANVKVVLTENAQNFVTVTTLQTLSQNEVYIEEFGNNDWKPEHIALVDWADVFIIAPATANTIGKIANGICDNLLTSVTCAFNKKILIASAMNCNMWENDFVQNNILKLKQSKNIEIIEPKDGFLACGCNGKGRMSEPQEIYEKTTEILTKDCGFLKNKNFIVTAGGTREPIDPIRCISNHSSGKMGIAVADEIFNAGGNVILISTVAVKRQYKVINVNTTEEILNAVKDNLEEDTNVVMAASISDYKVENVADKKIKKENNDSLTIKLIKNVDVLKEIAKIRTDKQKIIGFCAETDNLIENAVKKVKAKNLNYIIANDVSRKDIGFNVDYNEVVIIDKNENQFKIERDTKNNIAKKILKYIFES